MLLSIGMIVKNEEKYLRDCLTSLKPLLEGIESELIICDTGSTDSTVEIAREFADTVLLVQWQNDFSWARNKTVDEAKGRWYMFVDADEIFTKTDDIITFFKSGEYKRYGAASYVLENRLVDLVTVYKPVRLFKVYKGMRFSGKIHEFIEPLEPFKHLESHAVHYGYYHETAEEKKEKQARNLPPLLEELKNDPKNARTYIHLVKEYFTADQYAEALDCTLRGLEVVDKRHMYYQVLYHKLPDAYFMLGRYDEVVESVRNYFAGNKTMYQNAIKYRVIEALSLASLKRYEEALQAFLQGHEFFRQNKAGKLDPKLANYTSVESAFLESDSQIVEGVTKVYIYLREFDAAYEWIQKYSPQLSKLKKFGLYHMYAEIAEKENRPGDIALLYEYAYTKLEPESEEYTNVIMTIEKVMRNRHIRLAVVNAAVPRGDDYGRLLAVRKMHMAGRGESFASTVSVGVNASNSPKPLR